MKIPFVDLKAGYKPLKAEILGAIEGVLDNMNLFLGPNVAALETEFAAYCGAKYAVGVASGTDAVALALIAAGVRAGDEVITTPHTFFATIEAIAWAGATPVFVDIDPKTFNIAPDEIMKKITKKTKAIVPVHMYGHPADMTPILDVASKHGLKVIEDACQAHGGAYKGKKCGAMGDAGAFSFYYTKNLGAYGEAGIITTNDPDIFDAAKRLRNHGHKSKFEHSLMGFNSRLDEIQAAILRIRLKHLDRYNESRRRLASLYAGLLKDTPITLPAQADDARHVYHLYVVKSKKRDELMQYLTGADIGTGIHYKNPVHLQEACKEYGYKRGDFPKTEAIAEEILSLPMYPELTNEAVEYTASKIQEFYSKK